MLETKQVTLRNVLTILCYTPISLVQKYLLRDASHALLIVDDSKSTNLELMRMLRNKTTLSVLNRIQLYVLCHCGREIA